MDRFRQLVETTDAKIVLSTYWRHFREYIAYILSNYGIVEERVLDSTPGYNRSMKNRKASDDKEYSGRSEEIRAWLKEYRLQSGCDGDIEENDDVPFVILDDRPTAADNTEFMQSHFVHCETARGLTEVDVDRAIRILTERRNDS